MAKVIMVQGTMSNAGKSLVVAGLCRIFRQDGYRVAPFKSQNMALNSYITKEGLEMGRAQVVQAEACGIEPSVLMNPILLKPTTDVGSQVIINGKVRSNMTAREYYRHKKELIPVVKEAYEKLSSQVDIVVIEGAGSPAEVNLRDDDIVNMGMAEIADAPVLLVGDIDRGGVFAQLYGTIELLESYEKERIKGLIINKFRGDKTILDPGLDILRDRTGKEVLGVVPYMDVVIDDEDSLSEQLKVHDISGNGDRRYTPEGAETVDVVVIRLPRISNFTDFVSLSTEANVSVRYVSKVSELGNPDLIILPGTKSTIKDMEWLRATGLEAKIRQKHARGTMILGICGGYQMLGEVIRDKFGVETSEGAEIPGFGFLPLVTEFESEKTRSRTEVVIEGMAGAYEALNGKLARGYEIHMGRTYLMDRKAEQENVNPVPGGYTGRDGNSGVPDRNLQEEPETEIDGTLQNEKSGNLTLYSDGDVLGTYIHGFFDDDELRDSFVDVICRKKGIDRDNVPKEISFKDFKESQYDKLASILRDSLDMDAIYSIMMQG